MHTLLYADGQHIVLRELYSSQGCKVGARVVLKCSHLPNFVTVLALVLCVDDSFEFKLVR